MVSKVVSAVEVASGTTLVFLSVSLSETQAVEVAVRTLSQAAFARSEKVVSCAFNGSVSQKLEMGR